MPGLEVIAGVDDVVTAEMVRRDVVGVFDQGEEGVAGFLGQVEPVVALGRQLMLEGHAP